MPLFRRKKKSRSFTLSINPVVGNIGPGESISATVTVSPRQSEAAPVNLHAGKTLEGGGLSPGLNVSFNPPMGMAPFTSVMNISTTTELAPGAYPFLVIAAGEGIKQLATYTLIVGSGKSVAEVKKLAEKPAVGPIKERQQYL